MRRIELAISNDADLAFQRQFVKFKVDGLLRADAKTRAEVYTAALGQTNRQTVRMETNAGYTVERIPAAQRIT